MPAELSPSSRRLVAGVGLLSLVAFGFAIYAFATTAGDRLRLRTSQEDQRRLQEQETLLQGEINRLKTQMAENSSYLKSKQQELEDADRLRLDMEKKRLADKLAEQRRSDLLATMRTKISSVMEAGDGTVFMENGKITIRLTNKVLFNSGESKLRDQGREALKAAASFLASPDLAPHKIIVEGHTDNEAIGETLRWKYPTNWDLSAARACAAVQCLQEDGGIDPSRLTVVGYGETHPIASNDDSEGRAKNRRIDIIIDLDEIAATPAN